MTDIETMIEDAERHGRDSDPDHEVGDLQALARVLWGALAPDARARITADWRTWDADDAPITKICVKCDAPITAPVLAAHERERCASCGDDAPYTPRTVEVVRAILARRAEGVLTLCCETCPGWSVFDTARGLEIQACDECNDLEPDPAYQLADEDVAQLPEAQGALGLAQSLCPDCGGEHCPHYVCVTGGAHGHCDLCSEDE
jgi:hypothetical protein